MSTSSHNFNFYSEPISELVLIFFIPEFIFIPDNTETRIDDLDYPDYLDTSYLCLQSIYVLECSYNFQNSENILYFPKILYFRD